MSAHATGDGVQVVVETHTPGSAAPGREPRGGQATRSRGPGWTDCASSSMAGMDRPGGIPEHILAAKPDHPAPGTTESQFHHCTRADGTTVQWVTTPAHAGPAAAGSPAAPGPSAADLARRALGDLHLPRPTLVTAPPDGRDLLVGFPIWFWIADWTPRTAPPASAPGPHGILSAVPTATPVHTTLTFDDGTQLQCGRGTPWQRGVSDRQQHSDCTHVFTHHGPQRVTVTVTWRQTYTASNGETGDVGAMDRTSVVTLHAVEAQAVVD